MAYFEDLTPYTRLVSETKPLLAVGWLARGYEHATGARNPELIRAVQGLRGTNLPVASTGFHQCDLCGPGDRPRTETGRIIVPGDGVLFVAPGLILHYLRKHNYAPPLSFVRAAMASPEGRSGEYRAALAGIAGTPAAVVERNQGEVFESLEPVRLRPGMYIGDTGAYGLEQLLFEVVGNSLDEHLAGSASCIQIQVDGSGWVTVEDDGRGIPLDREDVRLGLETLFTRLHSGATADDHHPHVHLRHRLAGVGVAVVSALSARLEVETRRSGVVFRAAFSGGQVVEPISRGGETDLRGTLVRYLPDDEIFDAGARLNLQAVERRLLEIAALCPTLDLRLQGRSLQRPEGLAGWVREMVPDVIKESSFSTAGTSQQVEVEVALAWSPTGVAPRIRSFANYAETPNNGSHVEGLIDAVKSVCLDKKAVNGLVAVVHVGLLDPVFKGPTKTNLHVDIASAAVLEVVGKALKAAPWWWDAVHEAKRRSPG